jgi:hypothetical protein
MTSLGSTRDADDGSTARIEHHRTINTPALEAGEIWPTASSPAHPLIADAARVLGWRRPPAPSLADQPLPTRGAGVTVGHWVGTRWPSPTGLWGTHTCATGGHGQRKIYEEGRNPARPPEVSGQRRIAVATAGSHVPSHRVRAENTVQTFENAQPATLPSPFRWHNAPFSVAGHVRRKMRGRTPAGELSTPPNPEGVGSSERRLGRRSATSDGHPTWRLTACTRSTVPALERRLDSVTKPAASRSGRGRRVR